ncbi:MAG: glycerophosphodiester phosphodiesterase [Ilumatobacteraceae bacterium]
MTLVIAHRGASAAAPENTVEAFRLAVGMGADGIELDVRRTVDDVLVVHHDAHVDGDAAICRLRRDELPASIPSLHEALDACVGAFVNIEIKNDPSDPDFDPDDQVAVAVAARLAAIDTSSRWLISSFRLATVDAMRRLLPAVRTAWLVMDAAPDVLAITSASGHVAVHPWVHDVTEASIRAAHALGLAVNIWTCDDPDRMRDLIAWGVDGICTNRPDVALAVRRSVRR